MLTIRRIYSLRGLLEHVVAVPARDGDERNRLGVVTNLLDEGGRLLDDFVEAVLGPLEQESDIVNQTFRSELRTLVVSILLTATMS